MAGLKELDSLSFSMSWEFTNIVGFCLNSVHFIFPKLSFWCLVLSHTFSVSKVYLSILCPGVMASLAGCLCSITPEITLYIQMCMISGWPQEEVFTCRTYI